MYSGDAAGMRGRGMRRRPATVRAGRPPRVEAYGVTTAVLRPEGNYALTPRCPGLA
ncbi:hypothetical protein ACL02R_15580 [Streptomyces sp. MS19]|uniref:hypothetical protein n=1 Tax=Streptomyces sp. MS19 TaxID=3385972 RepID=UPI0039A1049E